MTNRGYKNIEDLKLEISMPPEKYVTEEIFNKILRYCAYQERSEHEVAYKLKKYRIGTREAGRMIKRLKDERFIDDKRYALIFASGKLRNNKWGRIKIRYALGKKNIHESNIITALNAIDEQEYSSILVALIRSKLKTMKEEDPFILRNKLAKYLISKGFEYELVWEQLNAEISGRAF